MGRKSTFDPQIAAAVLKDIKLGSNVQAACNRAGLPRTTWIGWNRKLLAAKAAHDARAQRPESPPVPTPRAREIEQPEVVGTCTWQANSAAAVAFVELCGAVFDQLRMELRRTGTVDSNLERKGVFDGR